MVSASTWPPVRWEQQPWVPTFPAELVSRRMRARHAGPYHSAIAPEIADLEVQLPSAVVALADDASSEIARFDAEVGVELGQFTSLLLRSESASSSQIENLTSSARAIALAELGDDGRSNAVQIVANVRAMQAAIALADSLDSDAILAMHAALMEHQSLHSAGEWRTEQVWIGGTTFGPHEASFVPPGHRHVPGAIADLVAFAQRDDVPVLAQVALAHAQFETIHPFTDGNGRTGRALAQAMLHAKGLTRKVTLPVSAGLLADVDSYFSALTSYRQGNAAAIVELMAEASFAAITNGRQLVEELTSVRHRWTEVISARRDSATWRLADLLIGQPVVNAETVQRELGVTSANAHRALRHLVDAGVIAEFSGKQRRRLWQASEIIAALDEFAARVGRRHTGRA